MADSLRPPKAALAAVEIAPLVRLSRHTLRSWKQRFQYPASLNRNSFLHEGWEVFIRFSLPFWQGARTPLACLDFLQQPFKTGRGGV
jgi:hypothetical protein